MNKEKETIEKVEDTDIQETDTPENASTIETQKPKRKALRITLIAIASALVLVIAALVIVMEPWVKQELADIEPENRTLSAIDLAVGDTHDIVIDLADNERVISFVSDSPLSVTVNDDGMVEAIAQYDAIITATVSEIEYLQPELTGYQKFRSELRILFGIDERIDPATLEPRDLYYYEIPVIVGDVPVTEGEYDIEIQVGDQIILDIDLDENEVARFESGDDTVAGFDDDVLTANDIGETTVTVLIGFETDIAGTTVFMATRAETYTVQVSKKTGSSSSGSGSPSTYDPSAPSGGTPGSGSNTGGSNTGGGNTGGGYTRPYPLPSQAEVEAFVAQANAYGQSLGMGINSGLSIGNAGYSNPASTWEMPWSGVQSDVYWQIDWIYSWVSQEPGWYSGAPAFRVTWTFSNGEYYIYVLYG